MRRVFILGVDALAPSILRKFIEYLDLPNIKLLVSRGKLFEVKSTLPPTSAAAWVSIFTGESPCMHGVFDFYDIPSLRRGVKELNRIVSSPILWSKTIWFRLSNYNLRTLGIGVPIFYPARKLNGIIVSGDLFAPKIDERAVYPKSVYTKYILKSNIIDEYHELLDIVTELSFAQSAMSVKEVVELIQKYSKIDVIKFELFKEIYDDFSGNFNLLILVLTTYDHLAHYFLDEDNMAVTLKMLKPYITVLDSIIGKLLNMLADDDVFIVVSDHGQHTLKQVFLVNMWLKNKGYLKVKVEKLPKPLVKYKAFILKALYNLSKALGVNREFKKKVIKLIKKEESAVDIISLIDIDNSSAFSLSHSSFSILLRNRSDLELARSIVSELSSLSINGKPILSKVKLIDANNCKHYNIAPDIVYAPSRGIGVVPLLYNSSSIVDRSKILVKSSDHTLDSTLILYSKNSIEESNIPKPKSIIDTYKIASLILTHKIH